MQYRSFTAENYRFGYQRSERDNEALGGLAYATEFRMLDPRLGRWLSIDPIVKPWESGYAAFANNPIYYADPSGLDVGDGIKDAIKAIGKSIKSTWNKMFGSKYGVGHDKSGGGLLGKAWKGVKKFFGLSSNIHYGSFGDWVNVQVARMFNKEFRQHFRDVQNSGIKTYVRKEGGPKLSEAKVRYKINNPCPAIFEEVKVTGVLSYSSLWHKHVFYWRRSETHKDVMKYGPVSYQNSSTFDKLEKVTINSKDHDDKITVTDQYDNYIIGTEINEVNTSAATINTVSTRVDTRADGDGNVLLKIPNELVIAGQINVYVETPAKYTNKESGDEKNPSVWSVKLVGLFQFFSIKLPWPQEAPVIFNK